MKFYKFEKGDRKNPPVLLVHGVLGSSRNLQRLADRIVQEGFFVIAYDQRGHGHSSHGPVTDYTLSQLAKDLFSVLDESQIQRAHLVGHSLGGRVCLAATGLNQKRVLTLSMLDVGVHISSQAHSGIRGIIEPLRESYSSKEEAHDDFAKHGRQVQAFLMSNLRASKEGEYHWIFDLEGIRKALLQSISTDQTEIWKKVQCPILIARGENSTHFSQVQLQEMLEMNSNARAEIIPEAGHWLHADNLEDTAKAVIRFLKAH